MPLPENFWDTDDEAPPPPAQGPWFVEPRVDATGQIPAMFRMQLDQEYRFSWCVDRFDVPLTARYHYGPRVGTRAGVAVQSAEIRIFALVFDWHNVEADIAPLRWLEVSAIWDKLRDLYEGFQPKRHDLLLTNRRIVNTREEFKLEWHLDVWEDNNLKNVPEALWKAMQANGTRFYLDWEAPHAAP